jgi:hypothetical protein
VTKERKQISNITGKIAGTYSGGLIFGGLSTQTSLLSYRPFSGISKCSAKACLCFNQPLISRMALQENILLMLINSIVLANQQSGRNKSPDLRCGVNTTSLVEFKQQ